MRVLGVSGGLGHDAAAALVVDGVLVAAAEEERFVRTKGALHLPAVSAVKYCLDAGALALEDLDALALAWDPALDPGAASLRDGVTALLRHEYLRDHRPPEIVEVDHHLAHAAASYYPSGLDRAAILVLDGTGERASTTLAEGCGADIRVIRTFDPADSLGFFYTAATRHIGLGKRGEGKVMGLAAYGAPTLEFPGIRLTEDGYALGASRPVDRPFAGWWGPIRDEWLARFAEVAGPRNAIAYRWRGATGRVHREAAVPAPLADFAASVQGTLERIVLHLVDLVTAETGCRRLVLGGGTALNCTANGAIRRSGRVDDLFVFPAAHDAGTAVGAALYVAAQHGEVCRARMDRVYLGPSFSAGAVGAQLSRLGLRFEEHADAASAAADLLCEGRVVGWYEGRMELGPRALGHRSILADPTLPGSHARVNAIKGREAWRPLAPSVLWEDARTLFGLSHPTPFMLEAALVEERMVDRVPAVSHVDRSTRPQTVPPDAGDQFRELLLAMRRNRGVGVVLNTSLNLEHEPIVCTPADALRTFYTSELDALVMPPYLVRK